MAECAGEELPYEQHWSVFSPMVFLQHLYCGNHPVTVSERISVKPKLKKCTVEEVLSMLRNAAVLLHVRECMYVCLESYTKAHVLRGCAHNLGGLKVTEHSLQMFYPLEISKFLFFYFREMLSKQRAPRIHDKTMFQFELT